MNEPHRALSEPIEPALTEQPFPHEVDERQGNPVPTVCAVLREARLRAGYDLPDVADALRIQLVYLEALEEDRFDDLPGMAYAIGFLRSYAGFLDLDADRIVGIYKHERALVLEQQRLAFPMPVKEAPRPRLWLILVVLVLAGLAYGGWQYYASEGRIATDLVADVSSRLTVAAGLGGNEEPVAAPEGGGVETPPGAVEPAIEPAGESVAAPPEAAETSVAAPRRRHVVEARILPEPVETPAPVPPVVDTVGAAGQEGTATVMPPAPDEMTIESAPTPTATRLIDTPPPETASGYPALAPAQTPASGEPSEAAEAMETVVLVEPAAPDATAPDATAEVPRGEEQTTRAAPAYIPRVFGRGNLDSRVVVTALADSWVQIQGPDNELLLTRILRPGDSYHVPDRPGLVMVTGNAGGLEIRVDDALVPALGPVGVVRRNIALAPDSLMVGGVGN